MSKIIPIYNALNKHVSRNRNVRETDCNRSDERRERFAG